VSQGLWFSTYAISMVNTPLRSLNREQMHFSETSAYDLCFYVDEIALCIFPQVLEEACGSALQNHRSCLTVENFHLFWKTISEIQKTACLSITFFLEMVILLDS
jgi:hypothetical protein